MKRSIERFFLAMLGLLVVGFAAAEQAVNGVAIDDAIAVPMEEKSAATYYVAIHIEGLGSVDFLVDTGSSYMAINEKTLAVLKQQEQVAYIKELTGVMADGSRKVVPVYSIARIGIGDQCTLHNVEAAVFPDNTRNILGLSALRRAAPFVFSTTPPSLTLSNCGKEGALSPLARAD